MCDESVCTHGFGAKAGKQLQIMAAGALALLASAGHQQLGGAIVS